VGLKECLSCFVYFCLIWAKFYRKDANKLLSGYEYHDVDTVEAVFRWRTPTNVYKLPAARVGCQNWVKFRRTLARFTKSCAKGTVRACTLHTVQCTLHSAHCTVHTVNCTLHTSQCTLDSAHCTLQSYDIQTSGRPSHSPRTTSQRAPALIVFTDLTRNFSYAFYINLCFLAAYI
jgi:hypothetical protein